MAVPIHVHPYCGVLRGCCAAEVVCEFDGLPLLAQQRMLDGLGAAVEGQYQHILMAKMSKKFESVGKSGPSRDQMETMFANLEKPDPKCPVVKALTAKFAKVALVHSDLVCTLKRELIPMWGVPRAGQMLISRHNQDLVREPARRQRMKDTGDYEALTTNSTQLKVLGGTTHNWSCLRKITIPKLQLFETATGVMLEGTLVVEPKVLVGITTLMRDTSGNVIQLGLYNQLPGGASGPESQAAADACFPRGTKLAIAEPFMKVFMDGNRGIRVDAPADIRVDRIAGQGMSLVKAKDEGGSAVARIVMGFTSEV